jgi:hypothetical protein
MVEVSAVFRMFESTSTVHGIQLVLCAVVQLTEGIILLHNSAHPHMAYRVQDQLNAMLNLTHPVALYIYIYIYKPNKYPSEHNMCWKDTIVVNAVWWEVLRHPASGRNLPPYSFHISEPLKKSVKFTLENDVAGCAAVV